MVNVWQLPYPLTDDTGTIIRLSRWAGRPAIVTMEYSESSLVCSATLAYLKELQSQLDARGQTMDFVVISIDPKNDTPQAWQRYRRTFDLSRSNWHFMTATEDDTPALARQLGVHFRVFEGLIIHRLRILRVDGQGRVVNALRTYYDDVTRFLDQSVMEN